MLLNAFIIAFSLVSPTISLPTKALEPRSVLRPRDAASWSEGWVSEYPIHESCNATETTQLRQALKETEILADHAKQHVLRWGNSSETYRKYFGNGPTAPVVGAYERVASGNKEKTLFRCDDPDSNCRLHPDTYGGHWRGENATDETVICPLSYSTRWGLDKICALGYNVAEWPTNTYFASDLLHRVFHMPAISDNGNVDHFTEDYQEVIELAQQNNTFSPRDSDALQYFALEAYAFDIAVPGEGCPGPQAAADDTSDAPAAAATSQVPAAAQASSTDTQAASSTMAIPPGCHTHAGGELHCE